ncbi:MAG: YbbR-like domain-containing protein [Acidobacteriota bacterium]|nr:YbbR-like domain-containing protein [Acidobacteriota bacterium]
MRRLGKKLAGLLVENIWLKTLSLAVAIVIWGMVASEPELSTFTTVKVEYKNLPDDLEVSSDPVTGVVLELRGPSGELQGMGDTVRPAVVLDMSSALPGERTYSIDGGNVKLARGVRLVRAIPSQVRFEFEPRRTRMVPVEVRFTGRGQNGYDIAATQVDPPRVEVVGPRTRVARITGAVTDVVDLSGVVGTSEFHVHVLVDDPYVRLRGSPEVVVRVTMKKM